MRVTVRGAVVTLGAAFAVMEVDSRGSAVWVSRAVRQERGPVGDAVRLHTTLLTCAAALVLYGFATPAEVCSRARTI